MRTLRSAVALGLPAAIGCQTAQRVNWPTAAACQAAIGCQTAQRVNWPTAAACQVRRQVVGQWL